MWTSASISPDDLLRRRGWVLDQKQPVETVLKLIAVVVVFGPAARNFCLNKARIV